MSDVDRLTGGWFKTQTLPNRVFVCGYCDRGVASIRGYALMKDGDHGGPTIGALYICPNCLRPTLISPNGEQTPMQALGEAIEHVPDELDALYEEARACTSHGSNTAAVMCCRKVLMHIAVDKGAQAGLHFAEYVDYLANHHYIPPNGKHWVDHIRLKGNEANHEIQLMVTADAKDLLLFTGMLLRFIYDFPSRIPSPPTTPP